MNIRRLISSIPKIPKIPKEPEFEPFCEVEFNNILKRLNINMITLTMKQKEDIETNFKNDLIRETKKERCDQTI